MQEEISKVEIILENCEVITVEGKHIGDFDCEDISYSISRLALNYIGEQYTCKKFSMSIHRDCNLNTDSEWTIGSLDEKRNPLNRILKYNDITSINIYFTKDESNPKRIYVTWNEDDDCNNKYQKSHMNKLGDLFIVVGKDLKFDEVFDKEYIEDEEHMKFMWNMYE